MPDEKPTPADFKEFVDAYLDYLEGLRDEPAMAGLDQQAQREAEVWVQSIRDARGIDPYARRPALVEERDLKLVVLKEESDG